MEDWRTKSTVRQKTLGWECAVDGGHRERTPRQRGQGRRVQRGKAGHTRQEGRQGARVQRGPRREREGIRGRGARTKAEREHRGKENRARQQGAAGAGGRGKPCTGRERVTRAPEAASLAPGRRAGLPAATGRDSWVYRWAEAARGPVEQQERGGEEEQKKMARTTRKTHTSDAVITALKSLSNRDRVSMNKAIGSRNTMHNLGRARNVDKPSATFVDSDNESTITVSDEEMEDSPTTSVMKAIQKSSPVTALGLTRALMSNKRTRDDDSATAPKGKKLREEIDLPEGLAAPIVYNVLLRELYNHDKYLPLSLFTTANLEYINSNASALPMIKLNKLDEASVLSKPGLFFDAETFQRTHLCEEDLNRGQWGEAAKNHNEFIAFMTGVGSPAHIRCKDRSISLYTFFTAHEPHDSLTFDSLDPSMLVLFDPVGYD
ncbi:hypothetical protein DFH06DRAFT_1152711 [Mycena polygramma]|nr:hypothetical protein DFH06DRAFT_1152711 [Mycena polygramma]